MSRTLPLARVLAALLAVLAVTTPARSAPKWDVVVPPNPPSESLLRAVAAVSDDEAWAVGTVQSPSYENRTLIAHYVAGAWSVVPSPDPAGSCTDGNVVYGGNRLQALSVLSPADIWAVGTGCLETETLIEHWNGTSWSIVPSPNPYAENILSGVLAIAPNDVWAVGHSEEDIGVGTLVEHWNGTSWSVVPSPRPGTGGMLGGVAAASPSDIWSAGSYYDETDDRWETLAVHWNGTAWSVVPTVNPGTYGNALGGVAVISANDVWAVGSFTSGDGTRTMAQHWDGAHWTVVPTPNVATGYGTTNVIGSVVALGANDVWACGSYSNQDTDLFQSRTLLVHWDGTAWSLVSSPSPGKSSSLSDLAFGPSGEAWAVGIYSDYPIDIYDGHYTEARALTLGKGTSTTSIGSAALGDRPRLAAPTPNPAVDFTRFVVELPGRGDVTLAVYDLAGRRVRTIVAGVLEAGERAAIWDGRDDRGVRCRSGLYFARLSVDGRFVGSRSVTFLPE